MAKHFRELVREQNNTINVEVISVIDFDENQKHRLKESLDKRFDSNVIVSYKLDKTLIGGAIIRSDNWIMVANWERCLEKFLYSFIKYLVNLPKLRVLNLEGNSLTSTIPIYIGRVSKLTELNLSYTNYFLIRTKIRILR